MTINAYPLSWPAGWPRTKTRTRARFSRRERKYGHGGSWMQNAALSVADGVERVMGELARLGVNDDDIVISTNVRVRLDGRPRSSEPEPSDPGVAVYWQERSNKSARVIAVDQYDRVADNLAAIAGTLEALRAIDRWGGAQILERAFTGFTALPSPDQAPPWWAVLGCDKDASRDDIERAYRRAAAANHPDRGGSHDAMAEINRAYEEAMRG